MKQTNQPNALLLVSTHCSHCHALEKLLRERLNSGELAALNIINIEQSPQVAQQYDVRSVPWLKLGSFIFDEVLTPTVLDNWIECIKEGGGQVEYISYLLEHGNLANAIEWIEKEHFSLNVIIPLLASSETKLNVRIGIGAIIEHFEGTALIKTITADLIGLLQNANSTIKIDACHYLSLTRSNDAIEPLKAMLGDEDPQVREVAQESIEALQEGL